jgi:hypothetical protein
MMDEEQKFRQRPDGSTSIVVGWILVAIGIIAALFSGTDDPRIFTLALAVAQIGVALGILLISLGYIVKAIWFLPGRDIPMPLETSVPNPNECQWCGAVVSKPGLPCSAISPDRFGTGFKIGSKVCREKLKERGIKFDG